MLKINGQGESDTEIAQIFNNYFVNVGKLLTKNTNPLNL